jgi:hypothetical protein
MGTALTYARRYALFTLVGIAGEDDLDAPDLPGVRVGGTASVASGHGPTNGHAALTIPLRNGTAGRRPNPAPTKPVLDAEASAATREQLVAEMAGFTLADDLDRWAYRCLPTKNTLTAADARLVEEGFQAKLAILGAADEPRPEIACSSPISGRSGMPAHGPQDEQGAQESTQTRPMTGRIDKSLLTIPVPRRVRDKTHLRFVAKQPCLICGRQPSDPHHLRFAQSRGLGQKVSDEFTVPLCRGHHRELHRASIETDWWQKAGIDAVALARTLWIETHPIPASADRLGVSSDPPGLIADRATSNRSRHKTHGKPIAIQTQLPDLPR